MSASFFLDVLLWNICRLGHDDVVWFLSPRPGTVFIQYKRLTYHVIVSQGTIGFWSLFREYTITLFIDFH